MEPSAACDHICQHAQNAVGPSSSFGKEFCSAGTAGFQVTVQWGMPALRRTTASVSETEERGFDEISANR